MKQLTRYILRQSLGTTIFVVAALSAAIWLTQSLRLVDLIVNRGLSTGLFLYLGLLIVPRFVDIVLPIGIFVAVLFTYNKLIAESEIVVMRAAGLSQFDLAKPAILLGAIGILALLSLSAYFLPAANRNFKDLQFEIRNKFASAVLQEGTFSTISENLTVYVRTRERNSEVTGVLVQDERDPSKPVTIVAERGAFVTTDSGSRVLLATGNRQLYDRATGRLTILSFEKYTLDLTDAHDVAGDRTREPQERYLDELLFPTDIGLSEQSRDNLRLEAHMRLVTPLTALSFAMIPLGALLHGEFNRRGQLRRVLLAVLIAFLFETLDLGLRNVASRFPSGIALAYLNAVLPALVVGFILFNDRIRMVGQARPLQLGGR
jgi:lipopolysaccharide export system permease protein